MNIEKLEELLTKIRTHFVANINLRTNFNSGFLNFVF